MDITDRGAPLFIRFYLLYYQSPLFENCFQDTWQERLEKDGGKSTGFCSYNSIMNKYFFFLIVPYYDFRHFYSLYLQRTYLD